MPKLEVVELAGGQFQLRMRYSNDSERPVSVVWVCQSDDDGGRPRVIRELIFPVNAYRDITVDLAGDPGRKLTIRASATFLAAP